jgi:hypothetical protein
LRKRRNGILEKAVEEDREEPDLVENVDQVGGPMTGAVPGDNSLRGDTIVSPLPFF